jgi:hypothetical protein
LLYRNQFTFCYPKQNIFFTTKKNQIMKKLFMVLVLALVSSSIFGATYRDFVTAVGISPTVIRIWVNSDTAFGETAGAEVESGGVYSGLVNGTYDASGQAGANWRVDITVANASANFTIQLFTRNQSNQAYGFSGFIYNASSLPVELTAFTATTKENNVLLSWATKTELNNAYFEVQRAADGRNFETLATVEGAGTTIEAQNYDYTDAQPLAGVSYYRLKQMDFDGTTDYSQVLTVKRENAPQVALFPNPTVEKLTLRTEVQGTANVRIFDLNGRLVYERAQRFDNQLDLNVTELVAGQYFLEVRDNDTQAAIYSGTFVKQ